MADLRLGADGIVTLHDLMNHAAMVCDRLLVLDQRHVVANGPPATVLTQDPLADVFRVA